MNALPLQPEIGRLPYGWRAVPAPNPKLPSEALPFPENYRKEFSHAPKTILLGSPRRGSFFLTFDAAPSKRRAKRHNENKPTRYIVWADRSLRRVDKVLRKQFEGMTQDEQVELLNKAVTA